MESSEKKKRKYLLLILGIIVGIAAVFLVNHYFFTRPSFNEPLIQASIKLNKTCPVMINQETRLDSSSVFPENIFQYNYTLVSSRKGSLNVEGYKTYLEPILINEVKTSPDLKLFRENEVTIAYQYKDMDGVFLFDVVVTPDKYEE